jgi:archaellum component FlaC
MSDRDDMLLEALTGLFDAKFAQFDAKFDAKLAQLDEKLDTKFNEVKLEISGIKLYIENVLEKKLNAFYDNTVTITEYNELKTNYNSLKKEVEELKQTVNNILKKIS